MLQGVMHHVSPSHSVALRWIPKSTATWIPIIVVMAMVGLAHAQTTGIVTFSQSAYSVNINQSNAVITVLSTGSDAGTGTVQFSTFDGTATAGVDYVATNGTLGFGINVLSNSFTVPLLDNSVPLSTQTVNLVLFNPTGFALLGSNSLAVLTIVNVQSQQVQFAETAFTVNEGESNAVITLVRTGTTNG